MTQNRDLDPFTAEQLLGGAPVDGEVGPLADLLAAAAAPARADELMGEAAAVAAFRDAAGASRPAAAPVAFTGSRRALGLKVAIAVAAVVGTAGTAAAGLLTGDNSPAPVAAPSSATQSSSSSATGPSTTGPPEKADTGTGTPPHKQTPSATEPKSDQSGNRPSVTPASPRPTAAIIGLCRSYSNLSKHDTGRSDHSYSDWMLNEPSFQPLVRAAGGKDKVAAYCKQVLAQDGDSQGEQAPQVSALPEPSDRPSGRPTSDPTSRPAASETGTATTALPPPRGR